MGLTGAQLSAFFRSRRAALMLAGHPKQNIPRDHAEAVRWVVQFPDKARAIFSSWLRTLPKNYPPELAEQLVTRFRAIENEDQESLDQLFRCGLDELYGDCPRKDWLDFLIHSDGEPDEGIARASESELPSSNSIPAQPTPESLETFINWLRGAETVAAIADPALRLAAALTDAVKHADPSAIDSLGLSPDSVNRLRELLRNAFPQQKRQPVPSGVMAAV